MTLVEWLIAKQAEMGLVDAPFARLLGLHPATWLRFKTGKYHPSMRLLRAAMNRWPESMTDICHAAREEPGAAA